MVARWAGCAVFVSLLCPLLDAQTTTTTNATVVEVPGGIPAVARVVELVDEDPDRFFASVNAQLLTATRLDHDWREIPKRQSLSRYFELVAEIEQRFPGPIALGTGDPELRTATRLADLLGFTLTEDARRGFTLAPKSDDEEQAFRRAVAKALGFAVESWSARLNAGESWSITLPRDRAVSPVSDELWRRLTDLPLGSDTLSTLAHDQRTGLVIAGRARVSRETRDALDGMDLRRIRDAAPFAFRRYASAMEIERGRLLVPGRDGALREWQAMVGSPSDSNEALLHALLTTHRAKGAYLWHALHFAPKPAVDYFLGSRDAAHTSLLRRVFEHLDESSGAYESGLADAPGFPALARSIPFAGTPPSLRLPGGARLWRTALDGDAAPHTLAQLRSVIGDQSAAPLDEESLVLEVLSDSARAGPNAAMLPRLVRGIDFFERHPALHSPENVVLVVRGSTRFTPALDALDDLDPRSADVARDYLLAVAHLDRLALDWPREQLVIAFEGGIEWLRALAVAGRVDPATVERELLSWIAIHTRHEDAGAAAPDELRWLTRLLRALPAASDGAPGRGPLEQALLQSIVAPTEPGLAWMGLDYDSDRTQRLTATMAETLDYFSIPEADRLVRIDETLEELALRARAEDLEEAKRAATTLRDDVAALAAQAASAAAASGDRLRVASNPQRDGIAALAADILGRPRARGLAALAPRVEASRRLLAADLRPLLAAPRYLLALAGGRGSLLQDRDLVRKHRLVCANPVEDRAWSEATLERGDDETPGATLCGHVGALEGALSSFTFSTTQLRTGFGLDPRRSQAWFQYWSTTRWHRMKPEVTGALAAAIDTGFALLDRAARDAAQDRDGPAVELAASFVPRARLERAGESPQRGLVSPAEALMTGLAALERRGDDPALAGIADELGRARAAIEALGGDWRVQMAAVGPTSPAANGRHGPTLDWWPSYEGIDLAADNQALVERELVDLHLQVVAFAGRHRLPGFVASDLMRRTMEDLSSTIQLGHERDWESVLRDLRGLDDAYFETRLRECLSLGFYRLREL